MNLKLKDMRKFFITVAIAMFFVTVSAGNLVYNNVNNTSTEFVYMACRHLGIDNQTIMIRKTSLNLNGYVKVSDEGMFIIYVNTSSDVSVNMIIGHELTHIKQTLENRWSLDRPTTISTKTGFRYIDDEAKAIEIEAIKMSKTLLKEYRKYMKQFR
jgi:hypothetical protein